MNCPHCNTDIPINGETSDGYHTFNELYDHRCQLFITLCAWLQPRKCVWRSTKNADGSEYPGWFLMGINKAKGIQVSYHLPLSKWEETNFAETLDRAPAYDGHTSQDVLERLKTL